ncbi:MAG: S1 RNA-binding domain-containing protein [Chloroflexi bacterium]|nr:S1 RNA-binding domain-containing protein [Chloroflexota bacterium]
MADDEENGPRATDEGAEAPPAGGEQGMDALLSEQAQGYKQLRRGDVVDGVVVRVDRDEILVDIGAKSEAVVPLHEIPRWMQEGDGLRVGQDVLAYVMQPEDPEGRVVLSLSRAQAERGWRQLEKIRESSEVIEGEVVEHNKGGLIVLVHGVRGFVPLSQIADLRRAGEENVEQRLESMKGRAIFLKVIEINRRRNRLILSERAAMQERRQREKERLLAELQPGEVRKGVVSSICDFGAFVDLGGADGLIHLSELSWGQVTHPSQVLKLGQEVEVYVVAVDRETRKIALSLKRLQGEPWSRVSEKYQIGMDVWGKITKLATFGAFAEIEPGVEGLIHISELSDERITHPKQVVREGEDLQLRVIKVDPQRHRLGLSLRQVEYQERAEADADQGATIASGVSSDDGADSDSGPLEAEAGSTEPSVLDVETTNETASVSGDGAVVEEAEEAGIAAAGANAASEEAPTGARDSSVSVEEAASVAEAAADDNAAESQPSSERGNAEDPASRREAGIAEG